MHLDSFNRNKKRKKKVWKRKKKNNLKIYSGRREKKIVGEEFGANMQPKVITELMN